MTSLHKQQNSLTFKAPFTRDRTNVYPDENSSGLLRLHGSAKKFVHLTFPFTRSKKFVHFNLSVYMGIAWKH